MVAFAESPIFELLTRFEPRWMLAEYAALAALALMTLAEWLHSRRSRHVAHLVHGPLGQAPAWVRVTPSLRVVAVALATWGLVTLWLLDPKVHTPDVVPEKDVKHLLIALDVSPSMYLEDAGPDRKLARRKRASDVVASLFARLPMWEYRVSLVAFYTKAKPLLLESIDIEFLRHIFEQLPTYQGFQPGKTDLFAGLTLAAQTAKKWKPGSATLIVLTDGMTVPNQGMPRLPASIAETLVVGVGDPQTGKFIDGHTSRQDVATLRQVAHRLGGIYHNGNLKHVPSTTIAALRGGGQEFRWQAWSRRELALLAIASGSLILAVLPVLLRYLGSSWRPGVSRTVCWRTIA